MIVGVNLTGLTVNGTGGGFCHISRRYAREAVTLVSLKNEPANDRHKSATFTPPDEKLAKEFGIMYDVEKSWGGKGPIQASFPKFLYPGMSEYT
jgi:hypothetical protein